MTIAKKGQAFTTKGHISCQMGYDPMGDQLVNNHLLSDLFFGFTAQPTVPLGGYVDSIGYLDEVDFVDEVYQSNSYIWNNATSAWTKMRADGGTSAITTIPYPHHEVHQGRFYRAGFAYNLANGNTASLAFTPPASGGREIHLSMELHMTAAGTFTWYEDCTSYADGTVITPMNHHRNSLNASDATAFQRGMTGATPITRTGGTAILSINFAVSRDVNPSRSNGEEFICKYGSKNVMEFVNSTSANFVQLILEWYEHTPEA